MSHTIHYLYVEAWWPTILLGATLYFAAGLLVLGYVEGLGDDKSRIAPGEAFAVVLFWPLPFFIMNVILLIAYVVTRFDFEAVFNTVWRPLDHVIRVGRVVGSLVAKAMRTAEERAKP